MKILIVEDEKQLLDSMLTFLKESGMICEKAETLAEASEKADLYEYDCVVLDIGLPDGSGLKVINILQQKQKQPKNKKLTAGSVIFGEEFSRRSFGGPKFRC